MSLTCLGYGSTIILIRHMLKSLDPALSSFFELFERSITYEELEFTLFREFYMV